jgi:NDP-sugar pyrophosphorylase family protein
MNAMLLCAGLGTRFRPHTLKMAKPTIPFLTVPIMAYSIYLLEQLALKNLVINTHHLPHVVENTGSRLTKGQNYKTSFSPEPGEILGSGGGIQRAHNLLIQSDIVQNQLENSKESDDDFVVINGDELILFNHEYGIKPLIDFHKKNKAIATLLTTKHPQAGLEFGGVWSKNGSITRLGEKATDSQDALAAEHFTGVFIFSKRIFDIIPTAGPSHIFKDGIIPAMQKGETVLSFCDPELTWMDTSSETTYIESTHMALTILKNKSSKEAQLRSTLARFGKKFEQVAPGKFFCSGAKYEGNLNSEKTLFMGRNSIIHNTVSVRGFCVVGDGTHVHNGVIEDSVIDHGLHIHEMLSLRRQLLV